PPPGPRRPARGPRSRAAGRSTWRWTRRTRPPRRARTRAAATAGSSTSSRCADGELALELQQVGHDAVGDRAGQLVLAQRGGEERAVGRVRGEARFHQNGRASRGREHHEPSLLHAPVAARKSTRLNSSHLVISYAVFCLKK